MKRAVTITAAFLALSLLAGCGEEVAAPESTPIVSQAPAKNDTPQAAPAPAEAKVPDNVKTDYKSNASIVSGKTIGTVNALVLKDVFVTMFNVSAGASAKEITYYSSLKDGIKAVKSDEVTAFLMADFSADYYAKKDKELALLKMKPVETNISMITKKNDTTLLKEINEAIKTMKADGTMDDLKQKWITEFPIEEEPEIIEIPKIEGADTLRVGVSGDLPPLDYVREDGVPTGFNVALLAEISKKLNKNIELKIVNADSRMAALGKDEIDVFFWQTVPKNDLAQMVSKFSAQSADTEPYITVSMDLIAKK